MSGARRRWRLSAAAALAAAGLAGATAGCASGTAAAAAGPSQYKPITVVSQTALPAAWPYYATRIEPPLPLPSWTLTDTAGAPYDLATATKGHIVVLFFGYTSCADDCPTMMADLASALRDEPAAVRAEVTVLFVTVDPAHDTGAVLSTWLGRYDPSFVGLTASDATVIKDASELGIPVEAPVKTSAGVDSVQHGNEAVVFTPAGYGNFFWSPATPVLGIAHDLTELAG